jgi:hypothetical protein
MTRTTATKPKTQTAPAPATTVSESDRTMGSANTECTECTDVFPHAQQVATINQLFFGDNGDVHAFYSTLISKKCAGYKQQDVANDIYDQRWFVTHDEVVELLVASKLKCYYCRGPCYIHYAESFCQEQWTLERLSNDQGHNRANVVISCLKCNLNRGTKSSDKFKMGKQIRFTKTF